MTKYFVIMLILSSYIASSQNIWDEVFYMEGVPKKIEFIDTNTCLIVTTTFSPNWLYKSKNQGKNWDLIFEYSKSGVESANDICVVDSNIVYIVFEKGNIFKSIDGGQTFEQKLIDGIEQMWNITMLNEQTGIIAYTRFYVTRDSWETYKRIDDLPAGTFVNPQFINDSTVVMGYLDARANKRYFLKININTLKFELHLIDKPFTINDFCYYSDSLMFVCGKSNNISGGSGHDAIYKSTNGGINWRRVLDLYTDDTKFNHRMNPFGLQSIAFKDSLTGIAVGQFGKIVYTYDGGESWQYESKLPPKLGGGESNPPTMIVRYAGSIPIIAAFNGYIHRFKEDNLAPGPEHIYTISGRVWEGEKGQPGIPVSLGFRVTMTDSLGYYKFTRVKKGIYSIKALNKYFDDANPTYYYKPFDYEPLQYDIDLTSDTSGFNFNAIDLRTFYTASGYVLNTDSKGIANITFKVADSTAVSDSTGKFFFPRIESKRQYDLTPITEGYSYSPAFHTINLITGDTTDLKFTATPTTSVWESGKDKGIVVSPNPAFSYITISEQTNQHYQRYEIYDITGRKLQSEKLSGYRINISFLEQGTYYIRLYNSSGFSVTTGFIKIAH